MTMKTRILKVTMLVALSASAAEVKLGDWHVIGPFKDEEFGNIDRTLAYQFGPERDYFKSLGIPSDRVDPENLALKAVASSPDDIPEQGHSVGMANDGETATYWDDQDGGKLYVLRLDWKEPVAFSSVRLSGWEHHNFSPKTFSLVADGKVIAEVEEAVYSDNTFVLNIDAVKAKQLDVRISRCYGHSPAIRELEVFEEHLAGGRIHDVPDSIELGGPYVMKPFPGYLDLQRPWEMRKDYADGFYNLLPRGPAPSRMEAVYLYRTLESDADQKITVHLRMQDFFKVWLNGEQTFQYSRLSSGSRYQGPRSHTLYLKKGVNHLLVKNVSRWAEHGFSFAVEGMHRIEDPYYVDVNAPEIDARDYLERFKFKAEPIPMYSPSEYDMEKHLATFQATPAAEAYDRALKKLGAETAQALAAGSAPQMAAQVKKLELFLDEQVNKLPPILFIEKPLHSQNAIAPYDQNGSLPARICLLDPAEPEHSPQVIYADPQMRICNMSLSFDGRTIFFSGKKTTARYGWNLYEIGVDGKGFKQLTDGGYADISPCELPNGRIAFISTRANTFVECQGRAAGLLYTMTRDGSDVRLISANIDSDHDPRVTNDGRILFSRWDYGVEKNVFARHALWTVNPDGTNFLLVFGNTVEDPGAFWDAHAIPGRPEILATLGPHHNHQAGMIGLVWNGKGPEAPRGTGYRWITREFPIYGDRTYHDGYQDARPLNEKQFLVSYGGEKNRPKLPSPKPGSGNVQRAMNQYTPLKLLYLDAYGNERIIYEAPDKLSVYNAIPVQVRDVPPIIADKIPPLTWAAGDPEQMNRTDAGAELTATMMVQDVYKGISSYVKPGEAKYIAVMEQLRKSRVMAGGEAWGHTPLIGRGTVHARRLIGLVPVEEDGSAFFKVPALRSVSLNVLNAAGKTLMRMGSDMHVMPHENLSCIGCHEQREHGNGAVPSIQGIPSAVDQPAVEPQKQGWGTQGLIDYCTVVQPVWDKHCLRCHSGPLPDGGVNLTGDKTRFHNQSYDQLVDRDIVDHLSVFSLDHDEGTPNTVGAMVSTIDQYMDKEHCESDISWEERFRVYCWIDANVPYYPTYDYKTYTGLTGGNGVRGLGARDSWEATSKTITWAQGDLQEGFDRRCTDCHERDALNMSWLIPARMKVYSDLWGDKALTSHGIGIKWKLVQKLGPEFRINLTHPSHSSLLQAPLSKEAGGAGLCMNEDGTPVYTDKNDPDYQMMLQAIQVGADRLQKYPRIDMLGREAFMDPLPACREENTGVEYLVTSHMPNAISMVDGDGEILQQMDDIKHPQGSRVWAFDLKKAPGKWAPPVTGLVELDNGNILFGVYHQQAERPDLYEVSPDKKIVRTVTIPSLNKIAAVQIRP